MEATIGTVKFNLTWEGDIAADLDGGEQQRALKMVKDFKRLAGENGAPKERKTRTKKPKDAAAAAWAGDAAQTILENQ